VVAQRANCTIAEELARPGAHYGKTPPIGGAKFLADQPSFKPATTIARHHHERWDGTGYSEGLSGEAIPEAATIVTVADSFDAMTNDRPYRAHRSVDDAVREIVACSGTQFSPTVVAALMRLHQRHALPLAPAQASDQQAA
jgi:HD-GYP domain-containing protein (c-di-GMP phosphodiesterase class II)